MSNAQTAKTRNFTELTPEQREHLLKSHISVRFDKDAEVMEIGWAVSCGPTPCPAPHKTVAFYYCPCKPCPPTA